jgi:hypothetical protein
LILSKNQIRTKEEQIKFPQRLKAKKRVRKCQKRSVGRAAGPNPSLGIGFHSE